VTCATPETFPADTASRFRHGNYLAELNLDRADRGTVLTDLLAGQYQGAARVYRLEDATADRARPSAGIASTKARTCRFGSKISSPMRNPSTRKP